MAVKIQYRRGTTVQWVTANPVLSVGEPGYDTDLGIFKIGNGSSTWLALPTFTGPSGAQGIQGNQGDPGAQGNQGIQGIQGPAGSIDACWPVGSVFISVVATNPATLLGIGTWSAFGAGRVLVGRDAADVDFDTAEETGGAKTHTLTAAQMPVHTHVQNSHNHIQDPHTHVQNSHTHSSIQVQGGTTAATTGTHIMTSTATGGSSRAAITPESANAATAVNQNATATNQAATAVNQNAGGDGSHNNLQPYIVVFMWKRTG